MAQEPIFQDPCLQPFVDHPSDDTVRDSSVKKGPKVGVRISLGTCSAYVSKAIADMEHALGVRLFDRTAQDVEPNRYGRSLLEVSDR